MHNEKRFRWTVALIVAAIIIWLLISNFTPALRAGASACTPFIIAFATAYLLRHPVAWLESLFIKICKNKKHLWQHGLATFIVMLLFVGLIVLLTALLVPNVVNNVVDLLYKAPGYIETLNNITTHALKTLSEKYDIDASSYILSLFDKVAGELTSSASSLSGTLNAATGAVKAFAGSVFDSVIYLISLFYFLYDYNKIKSSVRRLLGVFFKDKEKFASACRFVSQSDKTIEKYVVVRLLTSLGLGILSYIGFIIIGLPYSVLLAVVVTVTNIIPYIGPFIGAVLPILIALTCRNMEAAIYTAILILVLQQLEGNIITPLITGDALKVSPLVLLVGTVVFGAMFGIWGMILGAPFAAICYGLLKKLIALAEKRQEEET